MHQSFRSFPACEVKDNKVFLDDVDTRRRSIARNISLGLSGLSIANALRFEFAIISFKEILEDKRRKRIPWKQRGTLP